MNRQPEAVVAGCMATPKRTRKRTRSWRGFTAQRDFAVQLDFAPFKCVSGRSLSFSQTNSSIARVRGAAFAELFQSLATATTTGLFPLALETTTALSLTTDAQCVTSGASVMSNHDDEVVAFTELPFDARIQVSATIVIKFDLDTVLSPQ
jgi:hypothetical protein